MSSSSDPGARRPENPIFRDITRRVVPGVLHAVGKAFIDAADRQYERIRREDGGEA
ncbi:hypothetical protein L3i22_023640 [Actinoplanes sp. L3-i22]|nr:hypothetical protein L3i22_023640 [Actinoplanes sp. L3-i22]